jgi:hypothetical protein
MLSAYVINDNMPVLIFVRINALNLAEHIELAAPLALPAGGDRQAKLALLTPQLGAVLDRKFT